jgi:hypothetical protein
MQLPVPTISAVCGTSLLVGPCEHVYGTAEPILANPVLHVEQEVVDDPQSLQLLTHFVAQVLAVESNTYSSLHVVHCPSTVEEHALQLAVHTVELQAPLK